MVAWTDRLTHYMAGYGYRHIKTEACRSHMTQLEQASHISYSMFSNETATQ